MQRAHRDHEEERPAHEPGAGRDGARPAGKAIPDQRRQIEDVRPRQKLPERQQVHELTLGEPVLALDQRTPRPEQRAAETGQRDVRKGEENGKHADFRPLRLRLLHGFLAPSCDAFGA